jgi:hypothetical protein
VTIEGHTDSVGSNEYNLGLSERRAESVRDYLQSQGVAGRMRTVGYGEERPVATNDTDEGRARTVAWRSAASKPAADQSDRPDGSRTGAPSGAPVCVGLAGWHQGARFW